MCCCSNGGLQTRTRLCSVVVTLHENKRPFEPEDLLSCHQARLHDRTELWQLQRFNTQSVSRNGEKAVPGHVNHVLSNKETRCKHVSPDMTDDHATIPHRSDQILLLPP